LPGGLLARRYGTKLVFGLGNLVPALLGFFIPYATQLHSLIFLRTLQGLIAVSYILVEIKFCYELLHILVRYSKDFINVIFLCQGVIWPSMHDMTAKWIPSNERSRFVSSYLGKTLCRSFLFHIKIN